MAEPIAYKVGQVWEHGGKLRLIAGIALDEGFTPVKSVEHSQKYSIRWKSVGPGHVVESWCSASAWESWVSQAKLMSTTED
jgi:hypothetical protein